MNKFSFFKLIGLLMLSNGLSQFLYANNLPLELGNYQSSSEKCSELTVNFIKTKEKDFYLIGRDDQFQTRPKSEESKEVLGECPFTFKSSYSKNLLKNIEIEHVCQTKNIHSNKVLIHQLKIIDHTSFKLRLEKNKKLVSECFYRRRK